MPIDERNINPRLPEERTHRTCAFCESDVALVDLRPYEYGLYGKSSYCRSCEDMLNMNMGHPPGVYSPVFDLHGWRKGLSDEHLSGLVVAPAASDDSSDGDRLHYRRYVGGAWAPREGWLTVMLVIGVLVGVVVWQVLRSMI